MHVLSKYMEVALHPDRVERHEGCEEGCKRGQTSAEPPARKDHHDRPPKKNPRKFPEPPEKKNISPARLGHHRAKLGVGERAGEREKSGRKPRQQNVGGR